jgi:hypothetical protein
MGLSVTLAGQDISDLVHEETIQVISVLGQGPGAGSEGAGESTTAELVVDLSPGLAKGAGQTRDSTYQEEVMADSPKGYWRMNSETGCLDVSGNGNDGTVLGTGALSLTTGATGDNNPAWLTDGVTYVRLPIPVSTTNTCTMEALIWLEDSTAHGPIFCNGDWNSGWGFGVGATTNWNGAGTEVAARVGSSYKNPASPVSISTGEWVHVVIAFPAGGPISYYINSVLIATQTASGNTPTGYCYIGFSSNGYYATKIIVDEVAVYNTVLSSGRIAAHYGAIGTVPVLVRQGIVTIKDATNTAIFGGRLTHLEDASLQQSLTIRTKLSCYDYMQDLDSVEVNEVYTGHDDLYIIKDILTTYAPWIDQSSLPSVGTYTFGKRYVRAKSVKVALQKIAAVTGYLVWVSPDAVIHYTAPTDASQAPFGLSDTPDDSTTYGYDLANWTLDETAIINRVYFYGGVQESADFIQDLYPQYNGTTNKVMLLAYYPHNAADGSIHITKNGSDLVVGNPFSTGSDGSLIADGGTAEVLLNADAETLTFDVSVLSSVTTLTATYRYNTPLVVVVTDRSSYSFYGRYFDGKLDDSSVLDSTTAVQRARVLLAQQAYGLESLQIVTWQGGLMAGQLVSYVNSLRDVDTTYQVQRVQIDPLGAGYFQYTVDLGAWNWGLTDLVMATARRAGVQDDSTDETQDVITAEEVAESLLVTETWTTHSRTTGAYRWRTVAVGDGADAYWNLFTWGP